MLAEKEKLYSKKTVIFRDALELGLSKKEYREILAILYRRPTYTELAVYSALWSEHCSYKNSILLLKTFPSDSQRSLASTGDENAGVLDIGNGLAVVFKIESHNHPTAIEPYQGAATGVGGIMRDIFTMGARPICSLNSLRFGPISEEKNRYLLKRAVKGIGDYGNCLGIPVIGGELFFDTSFSHNCLVNAMVLGIAKHEELAFAKSEGIGNPVFIVGATTGRDGVHGASFASKDLSEESKAKKSAVQVGDPFLEKLLMEATLELLKSDAVIAIQDMGAAGLSCASSEMSAKGKVGMELYLDKVPLREKGMSPYEIMLSESQERMLLVTKKGKENEIKKIFDRWGLYSEEIGKVIKEKLLRIFFKDQVYAEIPVASLVLGEGAPKYKRKTRIPSHIKEKQQLKEEDLKEITNYQETLLSLLKNPNISSRRPLYEQYDTEVGLLRVQGPGSNGGLVYIPETKQGLAVSTDCNSRYVYLDPYQGAISAVCEGARNVACCGAKPIGITNCLNFANPYIPENYYMFSEAIRGIKDACKAFQIPVTGGNVSFYNESDDGPIYPTPTIGMLGLLEKIDRRVEAHFSEAEKIIYLLGNFSPSLEGSEYLFMNYKKIGSHIPSLDIKQEMKLVEFLVEGAEQRLLSSAHDISLGGLATTLFKSAYNPQSRRSIGFTLEEDKINTLLNFEKHNNKALRKDIFFFGESHSATIISIYKEKETLLEKLAEKKEIPLFPIGHTTREAIFNYGYFSIDAQKAEKVYEEGLSKIF